MGSDLEPARQSASEAQSLAEENGLTDHASASELLLEYTETFERMREEARLLCEAGQDGNRAEVERRWETIQELDGKRK